MTESNLIIQPASQLQGNMQVPRDKSIAHRAVLFNAIAIGQAEVSNFDVGEDNWGTVKAMQALGVNIEIAGNQLNISGKGPNLKACSHPIDVGNSGTTIRLLSGVLAGQHFDTTLVGDESLSRRPMKRISDPLVEMGGRIKGEGEKHTPPLTISGLPTGQVLKGIAWQSKIASAQVKSAILLAGLQAEGKTSVNEPHRSRNHTEVMLQAMGANLKIEDTLVTLTPSEPLQCLDMDIPGDLSAAAFFIAAACIVPNADVTLTHVGINPTRTGIIDALNKMGAKITLLNERYLGGELVADIHVKHAPLSSIEISGELTTRCIDELVVLAAVATQATGTTHIKDAAELRVKESDRIKATCAMLESFGAQVEETEDGLEIHGTEPSLEKTALHGGHVIPHGDHRIAMSGAILGLVASTPTTIEQSDCIATSFPDFAIQLKKLCNII